MSQLLSKATVRLAVRAVLVGVGVLVVQLQASDHFDGAILRAAVVAGGLAALEAFTPLNSLVGYFKKPVTP